MIKRVFILNDNKTVNFLNNKFNTTIFQILPDPIPELKPMPGFSLRNTYNINLNKKILLHFGSLTERKGTLEILDAVDFLNNETITRIAVLLIGNTDLKMEKDILSRKSSILSKYPTAKIIFINKFVSEEMMKSCFDQSDFILML